MNSKLKFSLPQFLIFAGIIALICFLTGLNATSKLYSKKIIEPQRIIECNEVRCDTTYLYKK